MEFLLYVTDRFMFARKTNIAVSRKIVVVVGVAVVISGDDCGLPLVKLGTTSVGNSCNPVSIINGLA